MKRAIIVSVGVFCAVIGAAQEEDAAMKAAMYLSGASSAEELVADEIERLQIIGKVRINEPGRSARAILTEYQLAALEDYRRRCGDILSWEELALVDGFGKEAVEALSPYLSLWSDTLPGVVDTLSHFKSSLMVRATEKNIGTKIKAEGKWWQVAGAARSKSWQQVGGWFRHDASSGSPDWTASAELGTGRWSVLVGDFNVRYGQGIGIWSGFSITSLSTIDAFIKRPTGIRPVCSFTPSQHRGLAGEYHLGRWSLAAFGDLQGNTGLHASYVSLRSQLGLTVLPGKLSTDFAINYKGIDLVGEVAASSSGLSRGSHIAAILAAKYKIGNTKLSLQTRAIPSQFSGKKNGEYGLASGFQWKSPKWQQLKGREGFGSSVSKHIVSLTADASLLPVPQKDPDRKQLRIYGLWQRQMSGTMAVETKFAGRYRNWEPSRSDLRVDLKYAYGPWLATTRLEGCYCDGPGLLGYLDGGYKNSSIAAYLRLGAFGTNGWSSRIYCYEHDAPGTFTVPAYHGHGLTGSLFGSVKTRLGPHLRAKLCLRGALVLKKNTIPTSSLHFQVQLDM